LKDPLSLNFVIPVSRDPGEPVSHRIYGYLRNAILEGTLQPGEELPSTRDLAEQLGVSRTTIVTAYEHLLAEGFAVSHQGSRTRVAAGVPRAGRRRNRTSPEGSDPGIALSRFGNASAVCGVTAPSVVDKGKRLRYDFVYGRAATEVFPFETWRRLLLQQARAVTATALDYGGSNGLPVLREAIAAHLRKSRAVVCDPDQVIIVNGSQQALDLTARVLVNPGDTVAIEDPHYIGAREVFLAAGAKLCPVPVDAEGLRVTELPAAAKLVFTTPSHQFPTGTVMTLPRRLELLEWARQHNAVILEDDYDGEFHYEGQPVESMQGLDSAGRVVYTGTFSRTIFPSLRIGYLIVPKALVAAFTGAKWLCDRHTAGLEQATLAEFIRSNAYERHLRKLRKRNAARRLALLQAIEDFIGPANAKVTGEKSGAHLALWPRKPIDEQTIRERAAALDVGVYGAGAYYLSSSHNTRRACILLGFSRMTEKEIREGIRRLATTGIA